MTRTPRIALFCVANDAVTKQLNGLGRALRIMGVECFARPKLPTPAEMELFVAAWRPDAIFEWDRSRDHLPGLDRQVKHLVWVQSTHWTDGETWVSDFGGSDIAYTNCAPDTGLIGLDRDTCRWLFPAVDPDEFAADAETPDHDMIFAGWIPNPAEFARLPRTIMARGRPVCELSPLVDAFLANGFESSYMDVQAMRAFLLRHLRAHVPDLTLDELPRAILVLFDDHLVRMQERRWIATSMLQATANVALYGPYGCWGCWPEFRDHFRGNLDRAEDLARAYRSAWLNIHNSQISMHHRTMEVMSCGSALLVSHNSSEGSPADIANFFIPDEDFIWFEPVTLRETIAACLADKPRLRRIGAAAAQKIRAGHTWNHRAAEILHDLAQL